MRQFIKQVVRPLLKPWLSQRRFLADLRTLGVKPGGTLMVHSSLSSLGYVPGGPATILDWLLEALGPQGTLVLPTHTWLMANRGGRTFDGRNCESCVGQLSEVFRLRSGVRRSLHPSHSVAALGARSVELTTGHELCSTPCGVGTPYEKLLEQDGQILLLGVELTSLTVFHAVESLANVSYLMASEPQTFKIVDAGGTSRSIPVRLHAQKIPRRYGELEPEFLAAGIAREGQIGPARSLLVDGPRFKANMLARLAADSTYFLPRSETSEQCDGDRPHSNRQATTVAQP